ncbi:MAG: Double zinc ribbon [Verrucomicrobiota bacterium]
MPLINCTECGKQVSTEATACPNCGHPVAKMDASSSVRKIKCPYCHKESATDVDVCPHCHKRIAPFSWSDTSGLDTLLIVGGIILSAYFWFFYDTSVSTSFGSVNNIGLMQNRQLGLIVGIGLAIAGVIMFAISKSGD